MIQSQVKTEPVKLPGGIDIIVPIYRNAEMTEACVRSLLDNIGEISDLAPGITLINDSPDDADVTRLLDRLKSEDERVTVVTNPENLGFVRSVNAGLDIARKAGRDVLLVNSDTITFPETLKQLIRVARADPQIGFVSPRSNNASICSLPHFRGGKAPSPEEALANWKILSRTLPSFHFAPTCVGFYMWVSHSVLMNHGPLREDFGVGYEEENDLVMRAGKVGVRAVIANHAFAYHAGAASFSLTSIDVESQKNANLQKLDRLHPEFLQLVRRYESSAHFRAERLMAGLVTDADGRFRLVFDLTGMGKHYNGTNEHTVAVLNELVPRWSSRFRISGVASREVFRFHGLDKLVGLEREDPAAPGLHAVAIRLSQPFDLHHVNVLENLAPINVFAMLDTIAEDCAPLAAERDFMPLWNHVARHANGLLFNSLFSERTFCVRHPAANNLPRFARLLSTTLAEYRAEPAPSSANCHVLVLGNHFPHKGSLEAGKRLAQAYPTIEFVVIGGENSRDRNLTVLKSGTIEAERMDSLIRDAAVIVLPAHVEGFGLGLMHALAAGRPTVARKIPAIEEILATLDHVDGLFLFSSNLELAATLQKALRVSLSTAHGKRAVRWSDWADGTAEMCLQLLKSEDLFPCLVQRIEAGDNLRRAAAFSRPSVSSVAEAKEEAAPAAGAQQLTLPQLLKLDGRAFVESAYQTLLRRDADQSGLAFYVSEIEGGVAKEDILRALATSPEGATKSVNLEGLAEIITKRAPPRRSIFARILGN